MFQTGDETARSEIRLLIRLAILAAALVLVVLGAPILATFSDLGTIFFLAWLLAFLIRPLAARLARALATLPYGLDVLLAYGMIGLAVALAVALAGASLAESIVRFSNEGPNLADDVALRLAPVQGQLEQLGLGSIRLADAVETAVRSVDVGSGDSLGTIGRVAESTAGALGTLSMVVFMSVYIAMEREGLRQGIRRLVPARYHARLDLVEDAVGHSFGGFVRGQIVLGIVYGGVALVASLVLGLPYVPLVAITVAVLQTIPYFGPYVSWTPPMIDALLFAPDATVPAIVIMAVAMVILANVLQPRIIGGAVGLNPLAVLAVVLVGGKIAGVIGAVFSVPFAAAALTIFRRLVADVQPVVTNSGLATPRSLGPERAAGSAGSDSSGSQL